MAAARIFRRRCDEHDALFWLNDRPDLALRCEADGVHVGQDDAPPEQVRDQVGDDLLIGLSTHSPAQLDAALGAPVDQLSVGPVYATPTKEGRLAAGLAYVAYAAAHASGPAVVRDRRDRPGYCGRGDGGRRRADRGGAGHPRRGGPGRGRGRVARAPRIRGRADA